jgi:hypothetical protein
MTVRGCKIGGVEASALRALLRIASKIGPAISAIETAFAGCTRQVADTVANKLWVAAVFARGANECCALSKPLRAT